MIILKDCGLETGNDKGTRRKGWISLSTALEIGFTLLNRNGRIGLIFGDGLIESNEALDLDYIYRQWTKEDLVENDK